jgi:putative protein-disulfide isomerase
MKEPAMKTTTLRNEAQVAQDAADATGAASTVQSVCDAETGVCELPAAAERREEPRASKAGGEVLYVGDPMCSACWGISPALRQLEAEASLRAVPFRILVGGLRPGGGDAWTGGFRDFLRHHWEEIGARTGQPFSTRFLDRANFDYDTEPSCRAFVVLRDMLSERGGSPTGTYEVFAAIQRKFYVDAEDPTNASFYRSICAANDLDFPTFVRRFEHPDSKAATAAEFHEVRALGVRGFPTVLYRDGASAAVEAATAMIPSARVLAIGYATAAGLVDALDAATTSAR